MRILNADMIDSLDLDLASEQRWCWVWSEKVYRERTIEKEINKNKQTIHHVVIEDLQTHALRRKGDNRYNMSGTYKTLAPLLPFLKNHYLYVFLA